MKRLIFFIPLVLFVVLGILLFRGLSLDPTEQPSALIGKPVPAFTLQKLEDSNQTISPNDLKGSAYLLNVWATWCPACKYEHPYLLAFQKEKLLPIVGLNYKDERLPAMQWLKDFGDPYQLNIFDPEGKLGIDLGVYGAPETFLIDKHGVIRLRHAGVLDQKVWNQKFQPILNTLK